jgi:DNA-directed RNA polymerase specialized sigma24 family protein
MSQREIAEQTNMAVGTIKSRIRIGLEKVERLLRGSGVRDAGG